MDRNKAKNRLLFWYSTLWIFIFIALWRAYISFLRTDSTISKWVGLVAGVIAIFAASCKINEISLYKYKNVKISEVTNDILNYLFVFFKQKNKIAIFLSFFLCLIFGYTLGVKFVVCYICGMVSNYFSNIAASLIAIKGKVKISNMSDSSPNTAYKLSFDTSSAISLMNIGFSICVIVILYHIYKDYQTINGFILGFCTIAMIDCIGNVISKKASNCANRTIENLEYNLNANINPVSGLKVLTDNISDITILNSDFGLSFTASIIAAMTVGAEALNLQGAFFPIIIAANGIFASVFAVLFTRFNRIQALKKIYIAELVAIVTLCLLSFYCVKKWFPESLNLISPILIGSIGGFVVNFLSTNFLCTRNSTVRNISHASIRGFIPVVFQVLRESFRNVIFPIVLTSCIIIFSFIFTDGMEAPLLGIWGITLAILSMFATSGIIMSINIFAHILNNSSLLDETLKNGENNYFEYEDKFKKFSGIVSGLNGNYINISSFLCAVSLVVAYSIIVPLEEIDILNPFVLASLILGTALPYLFCSMTIGGIIKTSKSLIFDIKKQFRKYPQILREEMCPDNSRCIELASRNSTIQVIFYAIIICFIFLFVAKVLKTEALAGLILGSGLSVISLLIIAGNSSCGIKTSRRHFEEHTSFDNTKELDSIVNASNLFVALKDLMVPVCNVFIKFLAILALTLAPLFL